MNETQRKRRIVPNMGLGAALGIAAGLALQNWVVGVVVGLVSGLVVFAGTRRRD